MVGRFLGLGFGLGCRVSEAWNWVGRGGEDGEVRLGEVGEVRWGRVDGYEGREIEVGRA